MKLYLLLLLNLSLAIVAQEKKPYHISTDNNPVAQMAASVQAEYKKFVEGREKEQDLSPSPVLDTNAKAAQQKYEAKKTQAKL